MFEAATIGGQTLTPARVCAPMALYTHSAFRRLLADLGGCGAVWTEMLAARRLLSEDFQTSPWLRRRPHEGLVVYQLMARPGDPLERVLARMAEQGVQAVDLNLACDAHNIRAMASGSALWDDWEGMRRVVTQMRAAWHGWFSVKIRLGHRREGWQEAFRERMKFLEEAGVDAVVLHARFFEDKYRRPAQWQWIPWAAALTRLPLIANGDLQSAEQVQELREWLAPARAIMLGRMAVVCPWVFAHWGVARPVDYAAVWNRYCDYVEEDFPPRLALRRIQAFARYYELHFFYGHQFHTTLGRLTTVAEARAWAGEFFARGPALNRTLLLGGLR
ncbi:tRNA-dihydrouridine synthase family protein [Fontisphaera persica]|uniref:tRNA-dihydrouridine synthase family protein n=1 Tax=Fontisphaera persica TaxID=2974023 RepID=UPI0024C0DFB9|nr:tRNA-dihydrouridine synthase family protein [Fontisphaera persica]WCJ59144.1 tRNA-dihydrouridine synthase family protein [Fontisphaera persica]